VERACNDVFCDESISQWSRECMSRRIPWKKPLLMVEIMHVTTCSVIKASMNGRENTYHDVYRGKSLSKWLREILSRRIPRKKPLQMVEREHVTTYSAEKTSPNGRERSCHDAFREKSISKWSREHMSRRIPKKKHEKFLD